MKITQAGDMARSDSDYLIPVTIKGFLQKMRHTRLFVTGAAERTNVVAEDGGFLNTEIRNWAVALVNKDILKRRIKRQGWEK